MLWKLIIVTGICMLFVNSFHCLLPNLNGIEIIELNAVIEIDETTTKSVNNLNPDIEEDARLKTVGSFDCFTRFRESKRF